MTVKLLQTLSLVSFIVAGVLFLLGVALFFLLDIPKLYGDISGRTAKKGVEAIRQQNESSGNKAYKPSLVNSERGKLTDKITHSGRIQSKTEGLSVSVGTEKIPLSAYNMGSNETTVLEETAEENKYSDETTILPGNLFSSGETVVLNQFEKTQTPVVADLTNFTVDVDISFTGSSEIIE